MSHIGEHGVRAAEAEYVVKHAESPFPRQIGEGKLVVWGRTDVGRYLQIIFVFPSDGRIDIDLFAVDELLAYSNDEATVIRVIHAMDMTSAMKRQFQKQRGLR